MCVLAEPVTPAIDDKLTIDPPPVCFIASTACLVPRNTPREFTAISLSQASLSSMSDTALPLMPALFTRMSSLPYFCTVASTTAFQSASLVTSRRMNSAVPLARVMSAATCWPSSSNMSAITTLAPSFANRRAVATPIPDAAPLMIATFPSRRIISPPEPNVAHQAATSTLAWRVWWVLDDERWQEQGEDVEGAHVGDRNKSCGPGPVVTETRHALPANTAAISSPHFPSARGL